MQENPDYKRNYDNRDDEIDLRSVFKAIGEFFGRIGDGFIYSIISFRRTTRRYKYILLISVVTGVALALLSFQTQKPYYETSMLVDSEYFRGQIVTSLIDRIDKLCKERNYSQISKLLGVDIKVAENLRGLEAEALIAPEDLDKLKESISELKKLENEEAAKALEEQLKVNYQTTYRISATIYNTEVTDQLENGIKHYLKSNEFVKKRMFITRENNLKLKEKLQVESNKLDSLKRQISNAIGSVGERTERGSNNVILSDANNTNAITVFQEDLNLFNQQLNIDRELFLNEDVEVLEGFTAFSKPDSPGIINHVLVGFLIGLGIGYLIVLFIAINKGLSKIEKERYSSIEA